MAAPPVGLVPRLVFGLPGSPRGDCLQYGDDGGVIHVAGAAVVVASADPRAAARIIPGTHGCEAVTALATAPGRRLLAVAERGEKALISVYDLQTLKRRKTLQAAEVGSQEYMSLSFSPDGKQLLAQGGGPEWNLLLFAWERGKVTASVRATNAQGAPLVKCALSFGDGGLATTLGPGVLRIFRVLEGSLKALPIGNAKREALPYSCQAWLPLAPGGGGNAATGEGGGGSGPAGAGAGGGSDHSRQILGTAEGEILLLEGTELKATLSCDASGRGITALAAYGRGFAVGRDGGAVTLFERDDREGWRVSRTLVVPDHPLPVGVFAVAPNEEQLALLLEGGPMFTLGVGGSDLPKPDDEAFDRLGPGAHCGPVTGVDVCVRRPIIASASADRHVRLWNYIDRTCELDRPFPEEALCVSCHPSGTLLLVGCADRLRLVAVLLDDLRTVREIAIRGCRDVAFAHGGHLFAAANGASVSVHSTWTAETVGNLRGHNGKVRALCWSHDDTRLVTAGADGAVYEWRVADLKRERESVSKGVVYSAAAPSPDGRSLVAAGNDKRIRELEDTGTGVQPVREVDAGCIITALALPQGGRVLFAGTEAGGVRGYRFPLTGEYYEVKLHAAPVTRLALSWDDALLVSGGSDGAVAVSDVRDRDLAKGPSRRDADRLPWAEEVLVPRSELDERRARVAELEARVAELGASAEYQLRLRELAAQERLREATDRAAAEREADRAKFEALLTEKNEQELEYEERLKGSEARAAAQLAALDAQYQARLMTEVERYGTLAAEKEALSARWDEQNALLVESHERVVAELTEEYEFKLAEEALAHEALRREKEDLDREAAEVRRQVEEDADRELEEARGRGETRLAAERETALRLKGENGILRKKFQALARELEEQRGAAAAAAQQRAELHATIKSLERDAAGLRREIRERDDALGDKEGRIHELKRKNQELEKFKFVLDFKIKELKRQIEPREVEIAKMRQIVSAMDAELERYHRSNAGLDLAIQSLRLKESGLQSEVLRQRGARSEVEGRADRVIRDISRLAPVIQDPRALQAEAKALYQRYCSEGPTPYAPDDAVASEHVRQRQYLERTVDGLKKRMAADAEAHRLDAVRSMAQNAALLREINELRREIKALKSANAVRSRQAGACGSGSISLASVAAGRLAASSIDNTAETGYSFGGTLAAAKKASLGMAAPASGIDGSNNGGGGGAELAHTGGTGDGCVYGGGDINY